MCLLVARFRCDSGLALVFAANRDERYDRPARPVERRSEAPRVLAGLDEEAGGTWLAVNEHGVVAGLTNQPSAFGRDPTLRTRGALPFLAARHARAAEAVAALVDEVDPAEYNPCSLLVGDREALFSVEVGGEGPLVARPLAPGRYVLENRPLGAASPKTARVEAQLDRLPEREGRAALLAGLAGVLADHRGVGADAFPAASSACPERPANCVHGAHYGTRSSLLVVVPDAPGTLPTVLAADGPPCLAAFSDRTPCWGGERRRRAT